jgi:uncharacterized OB-fold protein
MAGNPIVGPVRRSAQTAEFFDWTARGELPIRRCVACGRYWEPRVTTCGSCGAGPLETVAARGPARVVSWAVIHEAAPDGTTTPVILVIAQLAEGPWWWSRVRSADPAELACGTELILECAAHPEAESIPVFRLAPTQALDLSGP